MAAGARMVRVSIVAATGISSAGLVLFDGGEVEILHKCCASAAYL